MSTCAGSVVASDASILVVVCGVRMDVVIFSFLLLLSNLYLRLYHVEIKLRTCGTNSMTECNRVLFFFQPGISFYYN